MQKKQTMPERGVPPDLLDGWNRRMLSPQEVQTLLSVKTARTTGEIEASREFYNLCLGIVSFEDDILADYKGNNVSKGQIPSEVYDSTTVLDFLLYLDSNGLSFDKVIKESTTLKG